MFGLAGLFMMFQRAGMGKGGLPLPKAFQYVFDSYEVKSL